MQDNTRNTNPDQNNERSSELDAKELIRKHIEDPNHEITDEDIRNVKLVTSDDPPLVGAEASARIEEREEADVDESENNLNESVSDEEDKSDKPVTPWDVNHS